MITCPWCGTSYTEFRSKCSSCGASLPLPPRTVPIAVDEEWEQDLAVPPPPPRAVPHNYVWRLLSADAKSVVGLILTPIGAVFAPLGLMLTLTVVAAPVGIPFLAVGTPMLIAGLLLFARSYQAAQQATNVLATGEAVLGRIVEVDENLSVSINGRHPWRIRYQFPVEGHELEGTVHTLQPPGPGQQPGRPTYVLIAPGNPTQNTIYPPLYSHRRA